MELDIAAVKEWSSVIAAFVNVAVIGMLLKIMNEVRVTYSQRLDAIKDQNAVIQERLSLAEDENKRLEKINTDLHKIGATLGIEEFKKEGASSVSIRDIGDNFTGRIAGRDIVDTLNNRIGQLLESGNKEFKEYVDKSTKRIVAATESPFSHDYTIEFMFERGPDRIQTRFREIVSRIFRTRLDISRNYLRLQWYRRCDFGLSTSSAEGILTLHSADRFLLGPKRRLRFKVKAAEKFLLEKTAYEKLMR